jgi:hypothetical protein
MPVHMAMIVACSTPSNSAEVTDGGRSVDHFKARIG